MVQQRLGVKKKINLIRFPPVVLRTRCYFVFDATSISSINRRFIVENIEIPNDIVAQKDIIAFSGYTICVQICLFPTRS